MNLGRVGLWAYQLDLVPSSQAQETAAEVDELGYGALWIPEMIGRESFVSSTLLLAASKKMVVATGIASIYARDALCANSAWNTVSEAFPDRFLLGLGVSHEVMVSGLRGHDYSKPYSAMKSYLDGMDNGLFTAAPPSAPPQKVLAALGPKMLELAAERTQGGSDRLVDAIVAWGDEAAIASRVKAHHDAGADHVCIQVLPSDGTSIPMETWQRLAPALLG